jgi:hypothetical protein
MTGLPAAAAADLGDPQRGKTTNDWQSPSDFLSFFHCALTNEFDALRSKGQNLRYRGGFASLCVDLPVQISIALCKVREVGIQR